MSWIEDPTHYEGLGPLDERWEDAVKNVTKINGLLLKENDLFEAELRRRAQHMVDNEEHGMDSDAAHLKTAPVGSRVSFDVKYDIALGEIDHIKDEKEKQKIAWERDLDRTKAEIDEHIARVKDLAKDILEFRRDYTSWGHTEISADKLISFFDERIGFKLATAKKLKEKNKNLVTNINRIQNQIQSKMAKGEDIKKIDFKQMKIECKRYEEQVREKNKLLASLKQLTTSTVASLNSLKYDLEMNEKKGADLDRSIAAKEADKLKLQRALKEALEEQAKAFRENLRLREHKEESKMPAVMEYVKEKAEVQDLERQLATWERAVRIAEMGERFARANSKKAAGERPGGSAGSSKTVSTPGSSRNGTRTKATPKMLSARPSEAKLLVQPTAHVSQVRPAQGTRVALATKSTV